MIASRRAAWALLVITVLLTLIAIGVGVYLYLKGADSIQFLTLIATVILVPLWTAAIAFLRSVYPTVQKEE